MIDRQLHKFASDSATNGGRKARRHRRLSPVVLQQLEDRICPTQAPYALSVVASTGATVYAPGTGGAAVGTLSNISLASINDNGAVAFLGTVGGSNGVVETITSGSTTTLTELSFTNRNFTFPQIDDDGDVIAQDQYSVNSDLSTYIRVWHTDGTSTIEQKGDSNSGDILLIPIISPDGTEYAYLDDLSGTPPVLEINGTPDHTFPAGSGGLSPMIANDGAVVYRDGSQTTSPIRVSQIGSKVATIADSSSFSALGNNPGIDATGNVVAFYGDLTAAGAANLNATNQANIAATGLGLQVDSLSPGPGIFVSLCLG
ncbi:MAG: hypothetical protein ACLQGP_36750 [Isosphaeraceae bacterium]